MPPEWKGKEDQDKGVLICEGATLTGMVTVDSGAERPTTIGGGAYLMKHTHVGHDAKLYGGVILSCGAKIGGHAEIFADTVIGLNAVVHQRQSIAHSCMIGMGAVVTKRLITSPNQKYAGNPAKWIGVNIKK